MHATLLLRNGVVHTLDARTTVTSAVAIEGSRIVEVGDNLDDRIGPDTKVVDLAGRAVMPGFIDAHTHWEVTAHIRRIWIDATLEAPERVLEILREEVARREPGEWIVISSGFIQSLPTKQTLDEIAPRHPVVIRRTMHTQMANTLAFELSGLSPDVPHMMRQSRMHVDNAGRFTGFVEDSFDQFAVTEPTEEELEAALLHVAHELFLANGITTIHDMPASPRGTRTLQRLHREGRLPLRVRMYPILPPIHSSGPDLDRYIDSAITSGFGDDDLRFGGVKLFVDGHENGAAQSLRMSDDTPREDQPLLGRTFEELVITIVNAMKAGIQLRMHAWGDFAQRQVVDAMRAAVRSTGAMDHRTRVEHMLNTAYAGVPLGEIRDVGLVPVPQAAFMYNDDPDPAVVKYPFRSALDADVMFANSSDCTGSQPTLVSPWVGVAAMLTRTNRDGVVLDASESVTLTEALRSYTVGSAYAGFEENVKGTIEVGKLADVAVLAADPYSVAPEELASLRTDMTIIGGEVRYRRE